MARALAIAALALLAACGADDTATPPSVAADASVRDAHVTHDAQPCTPRDQDCACTTGDVFSCGGCLANITCVDGRWPFPCEGERCAPADVSPFNVPAYVHASPRADVCTAADISAFFDSCISANHMKADCDAVVAANPTCAVCIESSSSASTRAALYIEGAFVTINVPGCLELVGGPDALACAIAIQAKDDCVSAACRSECPVTDDESLQLYEACITQAGAACPCESLGAAADACTMSLGALEVATCMRGQTFHDSYDAIVPIFCGGAIADAGGE